jgi:DUF2950 family protein
MRRLFQNKKIQLLCFGLPVMLLAFIISLSSWWKPAKVAAANDTPKTFASPQEAGDALMKAAKSGNQALLLEIFGPSGREILFSDDTVKDANALKDFAAAYETMHRWGKIQAGGEMLYVGTENFPFPIPLQQNSSGQWYFNTDAGKDEMLARRIGKDELVAMAAVVALANAEQQYFNQVHPDKKQYTQKFVSDPGKHDGLYWSASADEAQSPLGQMGDFARGMGYTNSGGKPQPFNGYYFRILTKQAGNDGTKDYVVNGTMTNGFAILAYPAEYQKSGIMSFLIGKDGVLYEKDLGKRTVDTAAAITEYNPGDGWKPVGK